MSDLSTILAFPPDDVAKLTPKKYDDAITRYLQRIEKLPNTAWLRSVDKKNLLEMLNPEVNSIPYMVSLAAQIRAVGKDWTRIEILLNYAVIFLTTFDPVQVRYVGATWLTVLDWTLDTIPQSSSCDLSIIASAMLRLDPTVGTFTSTHLRFLRICLEAGVPSHALPILDKNIYAMPTTPPKFLADEFLCDDLELSNTFITPKSGFTQKILPQYVLEYYLVGAHIYLGLRNYARARLFLEYVLLHPTIQHAISALQVEAYKRWVLVGLLAEGKPYPLPRTHDNAVMKGVRDVSKTYDALAESFMKRNLSKYRAEMDVGTQIWHEDGNLRLVKEAESALLRFRVIDLQKTFAALPIGRVAAHVGYPPETTLQWVMEMIRQRHLRASLTPNGNGYAGDAVLRFHHSTTSSIAPADGDLAAQTQRIEALVAHVRDADRRLQLTKEYVEYTKRQKRSGPDAADMADQMDLTWENNGPGMTGSAAGVVGIDDDDGDEDIMGGF
ncbi:hypothetical protein LTS00_001737 [Friedmanniomyces endolithicus]|uniref:COP9 signalosome complex subunit 3 N-terminal helical repeats domain-containing protein n=1 Tax=Friedmanniomyces endolithicus TaxID=329885 RepID=A0AAN6J5W8_9PEZI|nr:hypothetical protein LTS00_001737 [Friedmanniomyces endolithicus]KAK0318054.1 hypothetical protein LTR82_011044 [Friedmanniomyces endolithicus]